MPGNFLLPVLLTPLQLTSFIINNNWRELELDRGIENREREKSHWLVLKLEHCVPELNNNYVSVVQKLAYTVLYETICDGE